VEFNTTTKKNECGYLISGTLIIRYDNGSGKLSQKTLKAGGSFHFPPGSIHQEEALTDCTIIEASTPHFNDRVRVDEKYGQSSDQGMRSTKKIWSINKIVYFDNLLIKWLVKIPNLKLELLINSFLKKLFNKNIKFKIIKLKK